MGITSTPPVPAARHAAFRGIRGGLLTFITDGLFASVLAGVFYGSTVRRLWQGVASTVIGPRAFEGGSRTAALGILMHLGVALAWSAVFVVLYASAPGVRRLAARRYGVLAVASLYGPLIWLVMSLAVVPSLTGRPPSLTARWWIQLVGHVPFVAIPMVASVSRSRLFVRGSGAGG